MFVPIGIAIFGVVSIGSYLSMSRTLERISGLGRSYQFNVQSLEQIRKIEVLNWANGGEGLDRLIDTVRSLRQEDSGQDLMRLERLAEQFSGSADAELVTSIRDSIASIKTSRERRFRARFEFFHQSLKGWLWKIWLIAFSGAALIWGVVSLIVLTISGPVVALSRAIDELSLSDIEAEFGASLQRVYQRYRIIPREIAETWERAGSLIRRVAVAREHDFKALQFQKERAELAASVLADGLFVVRNGEVAPQNPVGLRILQQLPEARERILQAVREGVEIPLEFEQPGLGTRQSFILGIAGWVQSHQAVVTARDITAQREGDRAKSHFIGLLSHEIRTPVTSLVMAIRLLQRSCGEFQNPVHQKLIQTSAKDVERLRELLDDLLSISRFESGAGGITLRSADLRRILKSSHESFKRDASERGIHLECYLQDSVVAEDWSCEVDASKLGWALSNLMLNAIRHTPRGGEVRVELRRSRSGDGRRFFEYRVRDSGPGIAPERLGRLMDPYAGVYDLRVARTDATGSGLSIARQIAESHGGSLRVCSDPGRGCEFQLRFQAREGSLDGKVARSG